ncbi:MULTISPECIES: hypothetical protein [unclassified Bradyrhizobium]|jgi:uncharacterized membrane protein|uniref:hypothetical protein n=1 Tax=unclassified Bradyrhizobium TaxID=2631580 RepID=UPI001FFB0D68|nr:MULTISPECIES: hypothetical protein [unclassified Bradyrhizobium]MCK1579734.1 hypothetical protein [Bradyrhizobium sp. 168]MCK1659728.1 hypothetical protein [Bradyrhizobium sp. 151]UPJ71083.1 hypothetical protein IVB19_25995 [Bradyrhizobium sp. 187]UPK13719.1 hypothetical protein IVA93_11270 [Bradyrhizobium sp. 155]UPK17345.1 hypothetical protein IVA73_24955 [Bradyrhizobium sp. 131]
MSSLKRRIEAAVDSRIAALTEVRIAAVAATAANLRTQLNELHQLRDQIRESTLGSRATTIGGRGSEASRSD